MNGFKFNPAKIARLDDPGRLDDLRVGVMWEALGSPAVRTVLDVGAGTGMFAERFALLAPDAVVYAADTDQGMLDWIADKRAGLVEAGRIVPVLATETSVPLPDGVADLVIMVNLHHELDDPAGSYAEMGRLLAPGGQIMVVDWADRETPKGPPREVRASAADLVAWLEGAGFADAQAHEGLPYHTLVTARKL